MADEQPDVKQEKLESEVRDMKLKEEESDVDMDTIPVAEPAKQERSASETVTNTREGTGTPRSIKKQSRSPVKSERMAQSPAIKSGDEETVGGDVTLKLEEGKAPKLVRATSHKVEKRPPQLFVDYEDKTGEATSVFTVLPECSYSNKFLGTTEHALECDCAEEWGKSPHHISK